MKLNKSQLLTLQAICQKGLPVEKSASAWLSRFVADEGIGQQTGSRIAFSFDDIQKIAIFLAVNDYQQSVTHEDFADRMATSAVVNDEKLATSPITQDRVLVKSLRLPFQVNNAVFPAGHGIEFRVSELITTEVSQVVLVENLAAFLTLQDYPELLKLLSPDALAVYRGGQGIFSAQGSHAYLSVYAGQKIGFFDFDPAGLCQLGLTGLDALILPSIEQKDIALLLAGDKAGVFAKQCAQYAKALAQIIDQESVLAPWATLILDKQLAVMQETLLSRHLPLVFSSEPLMSE